MSPKATPACGAQAQTDALVTRRGYEQNEVLRRRFAGVPIDALYSSDAFRSIMTLTPIARERHLPINVRISLREVTTGVWEDCAWGNIAKDYPAEHKVWTETPWITTAPGATTFQQSADRVIFCLRRIAAEVGEDGTALVASHSCSIKAALCVMMGKPMTQVAEVGHGENTSVSLLEFGADGSIRVTYANDDSHLPQRLRRAWGGVAGSDINMVTEPWDPERQADILAALARTEHRERGAAFDEDAYLAAARQKLAQRPGSIAITYLKGEPVGSSGGARPRSCRRTPAFWSGITCSPGSRAGVTANSSWATRPMRCATPGSGSWQSGGTARRRNAAPWNGSLSTK